MPCFLTFYFGPHLDAIILFILLAINHIFLHNYYLYFKTTFFTLKTLFTSRKKMNQMSDSSWDTAFSHKRKWYNCYIIQNSEWVSDSHSVMSDSLRPHGHCSLPGSSVYGIFQAKNTGVGCQIVSKKIAQRGVATRVIVLWFGCWHNSMLQTPEMYRNLRESHSLLIVSPKIESKKIPWGFHMIEIHCTGKYSELLLTANGYPHVEHLSACFYMLVLPL